MELQEIIPLKQNNTFLVVGAIQNIYVPRVAVKADGYVDLESVGSLASLGIDGYYKTTLLNRYAYAKPDKEPTRLES
jgi:hypothetical protein